MRHKHPAQYQVGIDIDPLIIGKWKKMLHRPCDLVCADAVHYLTGRTLDEKTLIYADPPYVRSTRKRARVYRHDYSDSDHERLIAYLSTVSCMVMLSGYDCDLYRSLLGGWTKISFRAKTHAGVREESVWFNFDPPNHLHDTNYLGKDFREREVIKRRRSRLQSRIKSLSAIEQHGLLAWLQQQLQETL